MKLVIGLGNPGEKYKNNRHNVGFAVIDKLQTENSKFQILNSKQIQIFKTKSFMNDSGLFVKNLISKYSNISVSDLYIVHDDLDIELGSYKIQFGRGPKEHKGLVSIYEALGTREFWHVRVGIDARVKDQRLKVKGEQYVLEDFTNEEKDILNKTINKLCKKLVTL